MSMSETEFLKCLENPLEFEKKVPYIDSLISEVKSFPQHKEKVIQLILSSPALFERYIPNFNNLKAMIELFPDGKEKLFNIVLSRNDLFEKFIPNINNLEAMLKLFPEYTKKLVDITLKDPNIFNKIVFCNNILSSIKPLLPEIANANTVEEAKKILKNQSEITRAARIVVGQVSRKRSGTLFPLPEEVRKNIAGMVGQKDSDMIGRTPSQERDDTAIAHKFSGKPK